MSNNKSKSHKTQKGLGDVEWAPTQTGRPPTKAWLPSFKWELVFRRWKLQFIWSLSIDCCCIFGDTWIYFSATTPAWSRGLENQLWHYKQCVTITGKQISAGTDLLTDFPRTRRGKEGPVPTSGITMSYSLNPSYYQVMQSSNGTYRESGRTK